uniref:Uncharacterized protein n=1 Tax=Oryza barthii TaxID=65489 RepID=A0A0D3G4Z3_9ORYZ
MSGCHVISLFPLFSHFLLSLTHTHSSLWVGRPTSGEETDAELVPCCGVVDADEERALLAADVQLAAARVYPDDIVNDGGGGGAERADEQMLGMEALRQTLGDTRASAAYAAAVAAGAERRGHRGSAAVAVRVASDLPWPQPPGEKLRTGGSHRGRASQLRSSSALMASPSSPRSSCLAATADAGVELVPLLMYSPQATQFCQPFLCCRHRQADADASGGRWEALAELEEDNEMVCGAGGLLSRHLP